MGTMTTAAKGTPTGSRKLVDMNWDPITQDRRQPGNFYED